MIVDDPLSSGNEVLGRVASFKLMGVTWGRKSQAKALLLEETEEC